MDDGAVALVRTERLVRAGHDRAEAYHATLRPSHGCLRDPAQRAADSSPAGAGASAEAGDSAGSRVISAAAAGPLRRAAASPC